MMLYLMSFVFGTLRRHFIEIVVENHCSRQLAVLLTENISFVINLRFLRCSMAAPHSIVMLDSYNSISML